MIPTEGREEALRNGHVRKTALLGKFRAASPPFTLRLSPPASSLRAAQRKAPAARGPAPAASAAAMTLADADLVRGGLLNLGWGQGEAPPGPGPSLRQDLASVAVALQ